MDANISSYVPLIMSPQNLVRTGLILACAILHLSILQAQDRMLEYEVLRKGEVVGHIRVTQKSSGSSTVLRLRSEINTKLVFSFRASAIEESVFENNILVSSSLYRQLNGKQKANKRTQLTGSCYLIHKTSRTETFARFPIRYTLHNMYMSEPEQFTQVYSDNFQQFMSIHKIAHQHYRVSFPDGNYNDYFYKNGVCTRIHIHHTLYSAMIQLKFNNTIIH